MLIRGAVLEKNFKNIDKFEGDDFEHQRLEALSSYGIMDTEPEKAYDDIVALAARFFDTPIALVSLVDENRQWFKSKVGLSDVETARDISMCTHAIKSPDEIMIVEDASQDSRFSNNPLVTGELSLRFYAGSPIVSSSGHALGTLCVIDTKPRELSMLQKRALITLSKNITSLLELRKVCNEQILAKSQLARYKLDLEQISRALSHDLNSPILGIANLAKWIVEDSYNLDVESGKRLSLIQKRASRMKDLLSGIAVYCEPKANLLLDDKVPLNQLVQYIGNEYVLPRGFEITSDSFAGRIEVPRFIGERVLRPLIDNAIKHHDKPCGRVMVSAEVKENFLEIAIADDGPGIPKAYHIKVFDLFQALKPRDEVDGAGMGLSLVKKIINFSGGDIWIEPNDGRGLKIVFSLPL